MSKKVVVSILLLVVAGVIAFILLNRAPKEAPAPVVVPKITKEIIGTSVEGRNIEAWNYGTGTKHLVFVGGIHGGYEYNSVQLAEKAMEYLETNVDTLPSNIKVTVIPSANPDGVAKSKGPEGRFNAHSVDLNRNFDCKWKPESTWQNKKVSAGTAAFSEPEAKAIRDFTLKYSPDAFIFWHSAANAVYASSCEKGTLSETITIMNIYAKAADYKAVESFTAYPVTGDSESWLASINIPAITVELKNHEDIEWEKNLAGMKALFMLPF